MMRALMIAAALCAAFAGGSAFAQSRDRAVAAHVAARPDGGMLFAHADGPFSVCAASDAACMRAETMCEQECFRFDGAGLRVAGPAGVFDYELGRSRFPIDLGLGELARWQANVRDGGEYAGCNGRLRSLTIIELETPQVRAGRIEDVRLLLVCANEERVEVQGRLVPGVVQ